MMDKQKIFDFIGLLKRGRNIVSGEDTVERLTKSNKIFMVIIAEDASHSTKKKFLDLCSHRDIPIVIWGTKEDIGKHIGCELRVALGITNKSAAIRLIDLMGVN
jgi:ribosomal protein L7Ae-like RNA K-turn-binding protein